MSPRRNARAQRAEVPSFAAVAAAARFADERLASLIPLPEPDEAALRQETRDLERQRAVEDLFRPDEPESDWLQMAFVRAQKAGVPL